MTHKPIAVVLLSGGLDSATSAAIAIDQGYEVIALSLEYGQRHQRELEAAKTIAEALNITQHYIIDVNISSRQHILCHICRSSQVYIFD